MDRQTLLEQKKKRLQELKQRRLTGSSPDDTSVDSLLQQIEKSKLAKKSVEVGIQVDFSVDVAVLHKHEQSTAKSLNEQFKVEKECTTFDKAIQTTDISETVENENNEKIAYEGQKEELKDKISHIEQERRVTVAEFFDEKKLNESLRESIKILSKLKSVQTVDLKDIRNYAEGAQETIQDKIAAGDSPIQRFILSEGITHKPVSSIDFSSHFPELVVIAYSSKKSTIPQPKGESPGLVIVYSMRENTLFPEFFLHATAPVTVVKFDRTDSRKIIGGLANGKVVIWDLQNRNPTKVIIIPQLSTPVYSPRVNTDDSNVDYVHHVKPIVSLLSINLSGNECIVSFSKDGVVNVWSTSFLAHPKISTLMLQCARDSTGALGTLFPLNISSASLLGDSLQSSKENPEFLNQVVVSSENGKLYLLNNKESDRFIEKVLSPQNFEEPKSHPPNVTAFDILTKGNITYIISACSDWTLRLWSNAKETPLVTIPTNSLPLELAVRPGYLHFATLAIDKRKSLLQYWDLERSVFRPLVEIPLDSGEVLATRIKFNAVGDLIVVGFEDGTTSVWKIQQYINTIQSSDIGLQHYL
ncbi:hypothetical protein G9P44_001886 [Scheffersomyces stipitis]|nr:hypothetical protein G9P44_001886 [Scheffersomyces stipitis]